MKRITIHIPTMCLPGQLVNIVVLSLKPFDKSIAIVIRLDGNLYTYECELLWHNQPNRYSAVVDCESWLRLRYFIAALSTGSKTSVWRMKPRLVAWGSSFQWITA